MKSPTTGLTLLCRIERAVSNPFLPGSVSGNHKPAPNGILQAEDHIEAHTGSRM